MDNNLLSEQLEEGEIIDDDDFEDISDNSIIDSAFGKFVSSNENLRALSLSSDSESEKKYLKRRKVFHRKSRAKRRKKVKIPTESSDSDSSVDDLKGKLKEAVRISDGEGVQKNPLETRLKAMGGLISIEPVQSPPESKQETTEKVYDLELENLRMEALRTAVLNKCQRRKRKKLLEGQDPVSETVENKENNTPETADKEEKVTGNDVVNELDEDEDILRASLLAGLAKKISKQVPMESSEVKPVTPKLPPTTVLPKRPINKFKNLITNKRIVNKQTINKQLKKLINVPKPQVKPLIINVNADSDSEEDTKKAQPVTQPPAPKPKIPDLTAINNNVEKFLKEQRAKFETENQKKTNKTILEKSAVKLLPKSQQIEYQQLMKKLRNAEKRKLARKLALNSKKNDNQAPTVRQAATVEISVVPPVEVEISAKAVEAPKVNSSFERSSRDSDSGEKRKSGITSELTTLKETLKDIKMQRNGSLQIKSKYQVLTPIIRKITATSNDRKKQEQRIKALLQELTETRKNLAKSHERFSMLVRELVAKKEKIDKSCQETKNGKKATVTVPVTSTPVRAHEPEEPTISSLMATNNEIEDMDVCNSDETDIGQIDIVDPNDIDQIFKRKMPPAKSAIPEYVSPLNFNVYERYSNVDPHGIMCPYEVNGSCRDIDCTYKHYLKRNGEKP